MTNESRLIASSILFHGHSVLFRKGYQISPSFLKLDFGYQSVEAIFVFPSKLCNKHLFEFHCHKRCEKMNKMEQIMNKWRNIVPCSCRIQTLIGVFFLLPSSLLDTPLLLVIIQYNKEQHQPGIRHSEDADTRLLTVCTTVTQMPITVVYRSALII